ncbi:MAG: c-type cytochrome [Bacteroidia bacterium]
MKIKVAHIFFLLCGVFLLFSFSIYVQPLLKDQSPREPNEKMITGRLTWQKYNCQSCHQLYGLGGYLGPDLTNLFADSSAGSQKLRALTRSGIKQMPAFRLSEKELRDLEGFLKCVNENGSADPLSFNTDASGMINSNGEQNK